MDAWRAALRVEEQAYVNPNAFTATELCEALGISKRHVLRMIRVAVEQGRAKEYRKIVLDNLGRRQYIPAYVLQKPKP